MICDQCGEEIEGEVIRVDRLSDDGEVVVEHLCTFCDEMNGFFEENEDEDSDELFERR